MCYPLLQNLGRCTKLDCRTYTSVFHIHYPPFTLTFGAAQSELTITSLNNLNKTIHIFNARFFKLILPDNGFLKPICSVLYIFFWCSISIIFVQNKIWFRIYTWDKLKDPKVILPKISLMVTFVAKTDFTRIFLKRYQNVVFCALNMENMI